MIDVKISPKGTPYVKASELHKVLSIKDPLKDWLPQMIEYGFEDQIDYYKTKTKDWLITLDMAKSIAMIQKTEEGKKIREHLIFIENQRQDGKLLNRNQIRALMDMCRVLGFFSVQKYLEKEHFDLFGIPQQWWTYRAKLLGVSVKDLKDVMGGLKLKYINQRQALMNIGKTNKTSKYELIRHAAIDLFIGLGKSEEYAKNIALVVKDMAEELKVEIYDDDFALDFKSKEQKETIKQIKDKGNPNNKLLGNF